MDWGGTIDDIFNLTVTNRVPTLDNLISDQNIPLGTSFIYQFSSLTFSDLDGDVLIYTAAQSDGSALPNWLTFDPETRTFSGIPQSGTQGTYNIKVTADDEFGGTVDDTFQLSVVNQSPSSIIPLSSQLGNEGLESINVGQLFEFQFSEFSFTDSDGDTLTYNATQAGGNPLPNWMSFDPVNRQFTGTPQIGDQAVLAISVTAEDGYGGSSSDIFVLTVANRNPNGGSLTDQTANINQIFSYQVPSNTFNDLDGDPLTYSSTLTQVHQKV